MSERLRGLHHITALATDPERNVAFYTEVLGLRLVKQTINFDDPSTYHLYYGDELGSPGTLLTFFTWPQARRGRRGAGQATVISFSVPQGSLGYWRERLEKYRVLHQAPETILGEETLTFIDDDGLQLRLVAQAGATETPSRRVQLSGEDPVPELHAIQRLRGATMESTDPDATVTLLEQGLGFPLLQEEGNLLRFDAGQDAVLDLVAKPTGERGHIAAGTVHHLAWRVTDEGEQESCRQKLATIGQAVTPITDRQYFRSIYFREPGGVLFEIATDVPGFAVDEPVESLGASLQLPAWLESNRKSIEAALPPLRQTRNPERRTP